MADIPEGVWRVGKVALFCAVLGLAAVLLFGSMTENAEAKKNRKPHHRRPPLPTTFAFVHTSTAENTEGSCTHIDNPVTNGNPNARLVVTTDLGKSSFRNSHDKVLGVLFRDNGSFAQRWDICHADVSPMPTDESFNVVAAL
jgi:hypothetical protein